MLARRAAGSMRDSQSLLEQLLSFASERITVADVHGMLGTAGDQRLAALVEHLADRNAAAALAELDAAAAEGVDVGQLARATVGLFPRLHGGRGRLPGRGLPLRLRRPPARGGRGRAATGPANRAGGHADPRSDARPAATEHARPHPGRVGHRAACVNWRNWTRSPRGSGSCNRGAGAIPARSPRGSGPG